jgi:hypothetical protein
MSSSKSIYHSVIIFGTTAFSLALSGCGGSDENIPIETRVAPKSEGAHTEFAIKATEPNFHPFAGTEEEDAPSLELSSFARTYLDGDIPLKEYTNVPFPSSDTTWIVPFQSELGKFPVEKNYIDSLTCRLSRDTPQSCAERSGCTTEQNTWLKKNAFQVNSTNAGNNGLAIQVPAPGIVPVGFKVSPTSVIDVSKIALNGTFTNLGDSFLLQCTQHSDMPGRGAAGAFPLRNVDFTIQSQEHSVGYFGEFSEIATRENSPLAWGNPGSPVEYNMTGLETFMIDPTIHANEPGIFEGKILLHASLDGQPVEEVNLTPEKIRAGFASHPTTMFVIKSGTACPAPLNGTAPPRTQPEICDLQKFVEKIK